VGCVSRIDPNHSEFQSRANGVRFFSGCHYFVPLWDKTYDTYESYIERTPFSTNGERIDLATESFLLIMTRSPCCRGEDQGREWPSR
jgi:hypothetical protein